MVCGVPDHVDGRDARDRRDAPAPGSSIATACGTTSRASTTGTPIWPDHGIRILPGPSSLWFDATGARLPPPLFPGYDTLGTLEHIMRTGYDYSWFVANQSIVRKEFSLSGSEQNPDLTGRDWRLVARRAIGRNATAPVEAFKSRGVDFIVERDLAELVAAMNALAGGDLLELEAIAQRDRGARPRDRQSLHQGRADDGRSTTRGAISATGSCAPPRRTAFSIPRTGR